MSSATSTGARSARSTRDDRRFKTESFKTLICFSPNLLPLNMNQANEDNDYGLKTGEVSTGTSIFAVTFDGGVVMGADSRTTLGTPRSTAALSFTPHVLTKQKKKIFG